MATVKSKSKAKRQVFTVERKKWGEGSLLIKDGGPNDGKMCCLGFVGRQCGVGVKVMTNQSMPERLPLNVFRKYPEQFQNGVLTATAAEINDADDLTRKQKESQLRALFKKHGFTLRFV